MPGAKITLLISDEHWDSVSAIWLALRWRSSNHSS